MITAARIRTVRTGRKQSQLEFGELFGVDQSTISRWETRGPPQDGPIRILIEYVLAELAVNGRKRRKP